MPSAENISDEVVENTPNDEDNTAPIDTDEAHEEAYEKAQEILDSYKEEEKKESKSESVVEEPKEEEAEESSDDGVEIPRELISKINDLGLPEEVYDRFSTVEDLEWYVEQQEKKTESKPTEEKAEKKEAPKQEENLDDPFGIKAMEKDLADAKEEYDEDSPVLKFMERQLEATKRIAESTREQDAFRHEQQRNAHIRELEGLLKEAGVEEIPSNDLPNLLDDLHTLADMAYRRGSQPDVNELVNQLVALRFGKQIESKKEAGLKAKAAKTKKRFLNRPSKTSIKTPEAPVIDYNDDEQVYEAAEAIIEKYKNQSNK